MRAVGRNGLDLELVGGMVIWSTFNNINWWNRETGDSRAFSAPTAHHFYSIEPVGSTVYFLDEWKPSVWKGPVDGSADATLEFEISTPGDVWAMGGDESGLYWVACSSTTLGDAFRSDYDGSSLRRIAQGVVCARRISSDATHIYIAGPFNSQVQRFPKSGTDSVPQQIGQASPGVWGLAVDDAHVYFCGTDVTNDSPQNVYRTEKDGSGALQLLATGQIRCNEVFLDGNFVYWANQGTRDTYTEGSVWRASLDDLEPELVAGTARSLATSKRTRPTSGGSKQGRPTPTLAARCTAFPSSSLQAPSAAGLGELGFET